MRRSPPSLPNTDRSNVPEPYLLVLLEHTSSWVDVMASASGWWDASVSLLAQTGSEAAESAGGVSGADAAGAGSPAAGGGPAGAGGSASSGNLVLDIIRNPLTMVTGLIFLFYIMVLVPERRRQAEANKRRSELKKNDRVVTTGGILGTVVGVSADSDEITLRVDDSNNTKIKVLRSAIGTVNVPDKEGKSGG